MQGLLGVQGAGDAPSEQLTLNFAKIVFEYKEMQALTIKGELGMYGPIKHGIDLQDFEFKIEKVFQKANEAIMELDDADASALLPAVQDFETGILDLLGSLQGGQDFTGGVVVPPTDDVIT